MIMTMKKLRNGLKSIKPLRLRFGKTQQRKGNTRKDIGVNTSRSPYNPAPTQVWHWTSKVPRFGRSRSESASKRSFRLTQSGLVPSGTRYYTNADPHAFCPRSGESAMYSINSFTTSAIPLNCIHVSPWTFSAPQWHLRSLIILLILCKTKKTQLIFSANFFLFFFWFFSFYFSFVSISLSPFSS